MSRIKEARLKLGMTQEELSKALKIPKRSIENWETGKRSCPEYVENALLFQLSHLFCPHCGKKIF